MIAGVLPFLIAMLQSPHQSAQTAALGAIKALAWGDSQICDAGMSAGRIMQLFGKL